MRLLTDMALPRNIFGRLFSAPQLLQCDGEGLPPLPDFDVFFSSQHHDLFEEIKWASGRPESEAQGVCAFKDLETFTHALSSNPEKVLEEFYRVLTTSEKNALRDMKTTEKAGCVYQLNQTPGFSDSVGDSNSLGTIVRNAGVLWPFGFDLEPILFLLHRGDHDHDYDYDRTYWLTLGSLGL